MPKKQLHITLIFIATFIFSSFSSAIHATTLSYSCPSNQSTTTCQSPSNVCASPQPVTTNGMTNQVLTIHTDDLPFAESSSKIVTIKKPSSPKPTVSPTPTPIPTPEATPQPVLGVSTEVEKVAGNLSADVMFNLINEHRKSKDLPAFEKDPALCEIANSRGPELHAEIFGDKYVHQGFNERKLPFWITENMVSRPTEEAGFKWWLSSSIHRRAIEGSSKYACGACVGNDCQMLFTSWQAK